MSSRLLTQSLSAPQRLALWLSLLIPGALLGGALISEYGFGLQPCEMCYWQRWPHWAALGLAIPAFSLAGRVPSLAKLLVGLAAVAIFISGAIGAFHAGVEYGWWQGVTDCAVGVQGGNTDDIMNNIMAAPLIRCDAAQWTLSGISLAGFNFIGSCGGALAIASLLMKPAKPPHIRGF